MVTVFSNSLFWFSLIVWVLRKLVHDFVKFVFFCQNSLHSTSSFLRSEIPVYVYNSEILNFFFGVKLYDFYLKLCSRVILVTFILVTHKVAQLVPQLADVASCGTTVELASSFGSHLYHFISYK